jgi:DUF971 family protein
MTDPSTTATRVKAPHGASTMEITWADGHAGVYPHEVLRGYCPCASCQGHGGEIKFVAGGNAELRDIEEVGRYGLNLRSLCRCAECRAKAPT